MIINTLGVSRAAEFYPGTGKRRTTRQGGPSSLVPSFWKPLGALKCEGQRRVGEVNIAVRARGRNKSSVEEVTVAGRFSSGGVVSVCGWEASGPFGCSVCCDCARNISGSKISSDAPLMSSPTPSPVASKTPGRELEEYFIKPSALPSSYPPGFQ